MTEGYCKIIGIDEVGRGCLAGPLLVVAARALSQLPAGLKDSKQLTRAQREAFIPLLAASCRFGEGWVKASEINQFGLSRALALGARRALKNLAALPDDRIILDGNFNYCPKKFKNVATIIKADQTQPVVSAASIWAKVARDNYMRHLALRHRGYGFENHIGYGTSAHLHAIAELGAIAGVHRINFKPFIQAAEA